MCSEFALPEARPVRRFTPPETKPRPATRRAIAGAASDAGGGVETRAGGDGGSQAAAASVHPAPRTVARARRRHCRRRRNWPPRPSLPHPSRPPRPNQPRAFTPPPSPATEARTAALPSAPELTIAMNLKGAPVTAAPALPVRPAPRTFIPPVEATRGRERRPHCRPHPRSRQGAMADACPGELPQPARPAPRAFVPPGGPGGARDPRAARRRRFQPLPSWTLPQSFPALGCDRRTQARRRHRYSRSRRRAARRFAAVPQLRADGGTGSGTAGSAQISVPGLLVRGGAKDAQPTLVARVLSSPPPPPRISWRRRARLPGACPNPHRPRIRRRFCGVLGARPAPGGPPGLLDCRADAQRDQLFRQLDLGLPNASRSGTAARDAPAPAAAQVDPKYLPPPWTSASKARSGCWP